VECSPTPSSEVTTTKLSELITTSRDKNQLIASGILRLTTVQQRKHRKGICFLLSMNFSILSGSKTGKRGKIIFKTLRKRSKKKE